LFEFKSESSEECVKNWGLGSSVTFKGDLDGFHSVCAYSMFGHCIHLWRFHTWP